MKYHTRDSKRGPPPETGGAGGGGYVLPGF